MVTREMKIWIAASAIGLLIALVITAYTQAYSENTQNEIANNVIRFHVLPNSNSDEDQAFKNFVRDKILEHFKDGLDSSDNIDETRKFLTENLDTIRDYVLLLADENGYNYDVEVSIEQVFFPTRVYGDITFPPGNYEALRVKLGEGAGSNWWCVMFPPLCFVDLTQNKNTVPPDSKSALQELLTEETYSLLAHSQDDVTVRIKFKIIEWWQQLKKPSAGEYVQQ